MRRGARPGTRPYILHIRQTDKSKSIKWIFYARNIFFGLAYHISRYTHTRAHSNIHTCIYFSVSVGRLVGRCVSLYLSAASAAAYTSDAQRKVTFTCTAALRERGDLGTHTHTHIFLSSTEAVSVRLVCGVCLWACVPDSSMWCALIFIFNIIQFTPRITCVI